MSKLHDELAALTDMDTTQLHARWQLLEGSPAPALAPPLLRRLKARYLEEWHWEQRMFDIINDAVSVRYKAKLENRSYREGASRAGEALKELRSSKNLKEEFVG